MLARASLIKILLALPRFFKLSAHAYAASVESD